MATLRLQNRLMLGRITLPVVVVLSTCMWLAAGWWTPDSSVRETTYPLWQAMTAGYPFGTWIDKLCSYLLYGGIGYFLVGLNNRFGLIRVRASVQTSLYFLFVSVCPALHGLSMGQCAAACLLPSLYFLFRSYQSEQAAAWLFHSFVFLGAAGLFFPPLLWIVPVFWVGAYSFRSLHWRSFLASWLGGLLPYWLLFGHAYWHDRMDLWQAPFIEAIRSLGVSSWQMEMNMGIMAACLLVWFIVGSLHGLATAHEDKLRTRACLYFCILLGVCLGVLTALSPSLVVDWLPLCLIPVCILCGHFFALTHSRQSNAFFVVSLVGVWVLFGLFMIGN